MAVKRESIVNGTVGGVPVILSTALKQVEWVDNTTSCHVCSQNFGPFTWTHHCRLCGKCVCHAHSQTNRSIPGYTAEQRVCDTCVNSELTDILTGGDAPSAVARAANLA